ncbi:DarT ssDNA thymidine ADP-ribosyltransferase family protein [Zoogloea sp.]|uniref:DarT ssDNA thymidine ADP-ribosyltransferase family protein n=1 Tax=Zoogloea sp. TaxID=49181 RepID=UPI0035AED4F4
MIEEYVAVRGITLLTHFTQVSNLDSILRRGLLPRDMLIGDDNVRFNDQYRLDGTRAVCLSVEHPNYKMFYRLRQETPDVEWVVLAVSRKVLWSLPCAFCATNAASATVTAIPLEQRQTLAALKNLFADWGVLTRAVLGIQDSYPTNPQAEVLMLEGVPREYILGVIVSTIALKNELLERYPSVAVKYIPRFFSYRHDYIHWR